MISTETPAVTVLMANYNGARHLEAAVRSALKQTFADFELLIVDDASTDDSAAVARRLEASDARVRLVVQPVNGGPGAARNRGLAEARGGWIAIQDSDDLMHPERLARLVAEAERTGAEIVADDLLVFYEAGGTAPHRFLRGARARAPGSVTAAGYVRSNRLYGREPPLGVLKPLFHAEALRRLGLRYDESLKIGEDSDLVTRALMGGLRFWLDPFPGYLYRKHDASISHAMKVGHVEALLASSDRLAERAQTPELRRAFAAYRTSLLAARAYGQAIDALKARDFAKAARLILREPRATPHMWMPVQARLDRLAARLAPRRRRPDPGARPLLVFSRQRLVGPTNGSSAYLLSLCRGLRATGWTPHLVQPSPSVFGRWPWLRLSPEMAVFESHALRGGRRVGATFVCTAPGVWVEAAREVSARLLARLKLPSRWVGARPAPYAIAAPWTAGDLVFAATHAAQVLREGGAILTDYAFQNVLLPYALRPARSAVVMHDLFFRRGAQFTAQSAADSTTALEEAQEMALLGIADVVAAIQAEEGAFVASRLPGSQVVVAPMGVETAGKAQPGTGAELLFVGSNTAPNVVGLHWFFDAVWPRVRAARPHAALTVAGSVARAFEASAPGVTFLGVTPDLAPLYARAAVVVSPLTAGSGLKIKLVEALAHGKAVVATPVTLQGVEDLAPTAAVCADAAEDFADAVVALLDDPARRLSLGARALEAARARFGVEAACTALVQALRS